MNTRGSSLEAIIGQPRLPSDGLYARYSAYVFDVFNEGLSIENGDRVSEWYTLNADHNTWSNTRKLKYISVQQQDHNPIYYGGLLTITYPLQPGYNGRYLEFSGDEGLITDTGGTFGSGATELEMFVVFRPKSAGVTVYNNDSRILALSSVYALQAPGRGEPGEEGMEDGSGVNFPFGVDGVNPASTYLDKWKLYHTVVSGGNKTSFVNGVQTHSVAATFSWDLGELYVGRVPDGEGGWKWFKGYIAEIIIYNRALTAQERADVYTFFNSSYGANLT